LNKWIKIEKSHLLDSFKEDCQNWLSYALHAYGDECVYRNGIEAFANKYHILIKENFDKKTVINLTLEMDEIMDTIFLNHSVSANFEEQKNKGFGHESSRKSH